MNVGDGAGILIQVPDALPPRGRRLRPARRRAPTPPASRSCPATRRPRPPPARRREDRRQRGPAGPRLARRPDRRRHDRPAGRRRRAVVPPAVRRRRRGPPAAVGHRPRPPVLRRAQAGRARARTGDEPCTSRASRPAPSSTRACSPRTSSAPFFPDLRDERLESRARARALPLLHQHVPVVAARPPVPLHRPQRRDQHGDGQRELDAGPRGAARHRPASTASTAPSRSARPAAPTPPASTRCSSCCTSAATRSPTPC